jgi:hypothetical protein
MNPEVTARFLAHPDPGQVLQPPPKDWILCEQVKTDPNTRNNSISKSNYSVISSKRSSNCQTTTIFQIQMMA